MQSTFAEERELIPIQNTQPITTKYNPHILRHHVVHTLNISTRVAYGLLKKNCMCHSIHSQFVNIHISSSIIPYHITFPTFVCPLQPTFSHIFHNSNFCMTTEFNSPAASNVADTSSKILGGNPMACSRNSRWGPGREVRMKFRRSPTVCVWLNLETIRVPSARRIWTEVVGWVSSTLSSAKGFFWFFFWFRLGGCKGCDVALVFGDNYFYWPFKWHGVMVIHIWDIFFWWGHFSPSLLK